MGQIEPDLSHQENRGSDLPAGTTLARFCRALRGQSPS
jgi:hypothetical protein